MKLNLGCGQDYRVGWVNVDLNAERVDVRADVGKQALPYEDGVFDEIYASGILEQIGPNEEFRFVMNECYRLLEQGGRLTAIVPNAVFGIAFRDPFDCRRFTESTWDYLDGRNFYWKTYGAIYGFRPWRVLKVTTNDNGIMTVILEKP